tara:strand:- start:2009 stop:2332 length:324 start_codon:yes stop_codon:yes gene_type:complete
MSRGSQKNASKEGRLSTLSFRVYVMGKNDAESRPAERPTLSGVFFASFGDVFPALQVPTISEHLTSRYPYFSRGIYLRQRREEHETELPKNTHSTYFCPREREHHAH